MGFFPSKAYPLRHRLIHGTVGSTETAYASERRDALLTASEALCEFAQGNGFDVYSRLPVRRSKDQA
ncbi:MAG: hypothetical protein ACKO5K_07430 [Armatimonadota bacterium]